MSRVPRSWLSLAAGLAMLVSLFPFAGSAHATTSNPYYRYPFSALQVTNAYNTPAGDFVAMTGLTHFDGSITGGIPFYQDTSGGSLRGCYTGFPLSYTFVCRLVVDDIVTACVGYVIMGTYYPIGSTVGYSLQITVVPNAGSTPGTIQVTMTGPGFEGSHAGPAFNANVYVAYYFGSAANQPSPQSCQKA